MCSEQLLSASVSAGGMTATGCRPLRPPPASLTDNLTFTSTPSLKDLRSTLPACFFLLTHSHAGVNAPVHTQLDFCLSLVTMQQRGFMFYSEMTGVKSWGDLRLEENKSGAVQRRICLKRQFTGADKQPFGQYVPSSQRLKTPRFGLSHNNKSTVRGAPYLGRH